MKMYDLIWKRTEKDGKALWEKIGILIERDGKVSIKLDLIPVNWDGWVIVAEKHHISQREN